MTPETLPIVPDPSSYMDLIEVAPVATVSVVVLIVLYKTIMRLCDIISKKDN